MLQTIQFANSKMSPESFCYWLQGLLELCPDLKTLNEEQVRMVREHLRYVFEGKLPDNGNPSFPPPFAPIISPYTTPSVPVYERVDIIC